MAVAIVRPAPADPEPTSAGGTVVPYSERMGSATVPVQLGARTAPGPTAIACNAPFTNLFLATNGEVRACCVSWDYPLGHVATDRLADIWAGAPVVALRDAMTRNDFSLGCGSCVHRSDGLVPTHQRDYDHIPPLTASPAYPRRIQFNVSNACNLQCIQCDGEFSSSIRIHREGRPALPMVYDDRFFEDLVEFIPHLDEVAFTGGEPFLAAENLRIWDLLDAHAKPGLVASITTNGTIWNDRVEKVLASRPWTMNVSIDGFSKETFEAVRVGADRDVVFANLERFHEYTKSVGTNLYLFHCLMLQNHHEFGDLMLFAEERGIPVVVNLVTQPIECSLEEADRPTWQAIQASFHEQAERVLPHLELNAAAFRTHLERVDHGRLRPMMEFARQASGPFDETDAAEVLGADRVAAFDCSLEIAADGFITACSPGAAAVLGRPAESFIDRSFRELATAMVERYGEIRGMTEHLHSESLIDRTVTFGDQPVRSVTMAFRDQAGICTGGQIWFTDDVTGPQ